MMNDTIHSVFEFFIGLDPLTPIILACDGLLDEATDDERERYAQYIVNLKQTYHPPQYTILTSPQNLHIAGNIKRAVDLVHTPFMYVLQHDLKFILPVQHQLLVQEAINYPAILRAVRFNIRQNVDESIKLQDWPNYVNGTGAAVDEQLRTVESGLHFTRSSKWSDNNFFASIDYMADVFSTFFPHDRWLYRPLEYMMMLRVYGNCTRWCQLVYGSPGEGPYIYHLDGKRTLTLPGEDAE